MLSCGTNSPPPPLISTIIYSTTPKTIPSNRIIESPPSCTSLILAETARDAVVNITPDVKCEPLNANFDPWQSPNLVASSIPVTLNHSSLVTHLKSPLATSAGFTLSAASSESVVRSADEMKKINHDDATLE